MERVADNPAASSAMSETLAPASSPKAPVPSPKAPNIPAPSPPSVPMGLPVREVLATPCLARARVLAGASGLDRMVSRLNVMEVPDILPWVKPHELLLTTGYPLRDDPDSLVSLIAELDDRGLAAVEIKLHRY